MHFRLRAQQGTGPAGSEFRQEVAFAPLGSRLPQGPCVRTGGVRQSHPHLFAYVFQLTCFYRGVFELMGVFWAL